MSTGIFVAAPIAESRPVHRIPVSPGRCFRHIPPEPEGQQPNLFGPPVLNGYDSGVLAGAGGFLPPGLYVRINQSVPRRKEQPCPSRNMLSNTAAAKSA